MWSLEILRYICTGQLDLACSLIFHHPYTCTKRCQLDLDSRLHNAAALLTEIFILRVKPETTKNNNQKKKKEMKMNNNKKKIIPNILGLVD